VGASEGSIAVGGSGNQAQITIQNTDAAVVQAASEGITTVARDALAEQGETSRAGFDFGENVLDSALRFGAGRSDSAIAFAEASQNRAVELASASQNVLAKAAQSPTERTTLPVTLAALGILGLYLFRKNK
jgi:hypothetical protein